MAELSPTLDMLDAAESGDAARVRLLLEQDPTLVNASAEYQKTALHWAAEKDFVAVAEVLLEAGADVTMRTSWGATALEWAGYLGSVGVAELLMARNAPGMNLVVAAGLGKLDLVRELCENNDSLEDLGIPRRPNDLADKVGWPEDAARMVGDVLGEAFQVACRNGHIPVAEYLLDRGANINAKGYFGGTGLHWAAIQGHKDVVQFLLEKGADATIEDHGFNDTPDGWAVEGEHDDIAMLIRDFRDGGGLIIER